jgi:hypothetical protein
MQGFWVPAVLLFSLPVGVWGMQYEDPIGDTPGPDLIRLEYSVVGGVVDVTLTFTEALAGSIINPAVSATVLLDADRSNMTGFMSGPGFHTRFGIDYEIELFLGGFGDSSNTAALKYWLRAPSAISGVVERRRIAVPLGNIFEPNGSVFVVGEHAAYGTTDEQIFARIPLSLFQNQFFPICGEGEPVCVNGLFPCPLALTQDLGTASVSVLAHDPYALGESGDALPNAGMVAAATGTLLAQFPTGPEDEVASVTDPATDGLAQPGNNGEELTGLRVFRHADNVLSFELKLASYSLEDTAIYYVAIDLDGNAATGDVLTNGAQTLGIDLLAEYANFDNPIGESNPLAGVVYFFIDGQWCPLNYADYLATVWRSAPGYVYVTMPTAFVETMPAAGASVKVVAMTLEPNSGAFNDVVPNEGALVVPPTVAAYPEIAVSGNGREVADGDGTPSSIDHTDFGSLDVTGESMTRTFTISNSGTADLRLTGSPRATLSGTFAQDFTVTTQPTGVVAPGGATAVAIRFDPSAPGVRQARVWISSDDADENPYDFLIQGFGMTGIDTDGDGIDDEIDEDDDNDGVPDTEDPAPLDRFVPNIPSYVLPSWTGWRSILGR